jgi:RNA polymerase sigma factor (sigma-70 family)
MNDTASQRAWVLAALDQFEGRLVRYATRLLGDEHIARDTVQHTFLRLCNADPEEVGDRLAAWLFTVCRNRVLDYLRQSGREAAFANPDNEEVRTAWRESSDSGDDPARLLERRELHARIRLAVDALPAHQREAVCLYADGFTYREIASITARSEGSVRVIVHRSIVRLRSHPQLRYMFDEQRPQAEVVPPAVIPQRVF